MRHILVAYDVRTDNNEGKQRLRRVAKVCESYGQRVQNSVFECLVDEQTFVILERKLLSIIDKQDDSLRIYRISKPFEQNVAQYGRTRSIDFDAPIVL